MRHLTFLLLLALLLPMFVEADEYSQHVDASLAKMNDEAEKACAHIWNYRQQDLCIENITKRQEATGDRRATEEYCKKHYFPLDNKALEEKYNELATLRRTARAVGDIRRPHKGEMTQTSYAVEAGCVARELKRRGVKTGYERRY